MGGGGGGQRRERDCLGDECTMQCADDVLLSCTLETCMVLQTNCHPNTLFFLKKLENKVNNQPFGLKNKIKVDHDTCSSIVVRTNGMTTMPANRFLRT